MVLWDSKINVKMPVGNPCGIFKSKRAKNLAINYGLEINNKNGYARLVGESTSKTITYEDVKFIVDNLWLDHFIYGALEPIKLDESDRQVMYFYLRNKHSYFF